MIENYILYNICNFLFLSNGRTLFVVCFNIIVYLILSIVKCVRS